MMVRELDYTTEVDVFGALRYAVFVRQLSWVQGDSARGVELDHLDSLAHHIGVFDDMNTLCGYARVIQGGQPDGLLIEQPVFAALLPAGLPTGSDTGEVSRMCVHPNYQKKSRRGGLVITSLLFRGIYTYCTSTGIGVLYAMADDTDERNYNHKAFLMRLLPFTVVSGPVYLTAGVGTWLLQLDVPTAVQMPAVQKLLGL